jgi:putative spermidine/putrescine transport system ATP-binding protein
MFGMSGNGPAGLPKPEPKIPVPEATDGDDEGEESELPPASDPQAAMSAIRAALASEVKDEAPKAELKAAPAPEERPAPPPPEIKEAAFVEGAAALVEPEPEVDAEPAPEPLPFVRFAGVRKTYDGVALVVKDLNLDIEKGEFLTLLGPSGSGKTTTLLMLAGFETPTEGDILLEGKSLADMAPHQRGLGFVFQNYALFPHMTVGENLAFPLEVRRKGRSEIRQRVSRALKMVELEGFDKRKPHQLSGGQQQRIAVARALVFDPTLVLMDEPLGALDKHLREQMQYELKRLHRELGVTVVYVTHDQGEALTLSDRIAVFHDGVIQQLDTPAKIYDAPANAFVAGFIGENNALAGRVLSVDGNLCTVELAGGTRVKAVRGNVGVPGTKVVVCVRPENLTLSEEAGPRGGENQLAAMVDDMVFHGDHVRVKLSSTGGHEIDVKAQTRTTAIPAKGVLATLSWEPYACRAFTAS